MSHAASEWMPFYIDDFWGSEHVADMTDTEALLYQWCLGRQWQSGSLPASTVALKNLLPARFALSFDSAWPRVRPMFEAGTDGRLRNARCHEELSRVNANMQRAVESGRKGGLERVARLAQATLQGSLKAPFKATSREPQASERRGEKRREEEVHTSPPAGADKPRAVRKPSEAQKLWLDAWTLNRPEAPAWVLTDVDAKILNKRGKDFGMELLAAKIAALHAMPDQWVQDNLSPEILAKRWNNLGAKAPQVAGQTEAVKRMRQQTAGAQSEWGDYLTSQAQPRRLTP